MSGRTNDEAAASGPLVGVTWSLYEASKDALSISRGIIKAATTDNVQPLALATTEAFGTTLAMAPGTLVTVEKAAGRRDTAAWLEFLQSQVGWSAHDSTVQLARSDGGVRFLSLAAALITIRDSFKGAESLDQMLRTSASRNQMLPTRGQLQDLVTAIGPKLWKAGFADRVEDAAKLLFHVTDRNGVQVSWESGARPSAWVTPGPSQIAELVAAFTKLYRVGEVESKFSDDDASQILITATAAHAWIYAFVCWCLGSPPRIVSLAGPNLDAQPTSNRVVLICCGQENTRYSNMKIEICYKIESPRQLWHRSTEPFTNFGGFLSISNYGQRVLRSYGVTARANYSAVASGVGYILSILPAEALSNVSPEFSQYGIQVLPPYRNVESAYKQYMGCDMPQDTELPNARLPVMELPEVKAQVDLLRQRCFCAECTSIPERSSLCLIADLRSHIVQICLDILALGLLDELGHEDAMLDSASLMLWQNRDQTEHLDELCDQPSRACRITPSIYFKRALEMFGLVDSSSHEYPLAGAAGGQVIYLTILNQPRLNGSNIFQISRVAGRLIHQGETYHLVEGSDNVRGENGLSRRSVNQSQNLMTPANGRLKWTVSRSSKALRLSAVMGDCAADPTVAFKNHDSMLYINSCPHDMNAPLETPDNAAFYVFPRASAYDSTQQVKTQVVAVAGNEHQRFFSLAATAETVQVVVRGRACLACCLSVCRRAGYDAVIL